jgi:hypothetical protein
MSRIRIALISSSLAAVASGTVDAHAGSFDPEGNFAFASDAVATEGFETIPAYDADAGADDGGSPVGIEGIEPVASDDALEGGRYANVRAGNRWDYVHVPMTAPTIRGSYQARMWVRGGSPAALLVAAYATRPEGQVVAEMTPSGRCTSDGWVELVSNAVSLAAEDLARVTIAVQGQTSVDACELVPAGAYVELPSCSGVRDPVCGPDALCLSGSCRQGDALVPALPPAHDRGRVVDLLEMRLRWFYGGSLSRRRYLPDALAQLDKMRSAQTPWSFWNHLATAIHKLHDWHTHLDGTMLLLDRPKHLNLCFIEGHADQSQDAWPSHPRYLDILVSHTGPDRNLGLHPGDRLVAVDGLHPIEWARGLVDVDWGWWQADDDEVNAEFVERMRGLIPVFARSVTVIRCDPAALACSTTPEVIQVSDLPDDDADQAPIVQCDNRPGYHLVNGPDPATHGVGDGLFMGLLIDSEPGEALYGMTWDSLWGPSYTTQFKQYNAELKAHARGVILDHRAGNGGTIDAPEAITELVRDKFPLAIFPYLRPSAGAEGPDTLDDGVAIYDTYKSNPYVTYNVGSSAPDKLLPVALLIHRDGSASDYLPFGMKGAAKVRIFGPHQTAGAFSSFFQIDFWGNTALQVAGGDTISYQGQAMIGSGAAPDEIVVPLQSDLLVGKDTIYERALAWVRAEAKP